MYFCKKKVMIKIGDRVKFLNDVGGGIVTGFLGKNMVTVENEVGFEVPYPVSKLINVDDPKLNKDSNIANAVLPEKSPEPEKIIKPKGKIVAGKDSPDFYFCFLPDNPQNPVSGDIKLVFVNDSNFIVLFHYSHFFEGKYKSVLHGKAQPNTKRELEIITQSDLTELPEYSFQLLFFRDGQTESFPSVNKQFRVNPVKFYKEKSFKANSFFSRNALIYKISDNILTDEIDKLTDDDFRKLIKDKEKNQLEKRDTKAKMPEVIEVDLHIHELIDNPSGLENREILEIQLEKVEREMNYAIQNRAGRIVFIHGVGQGVLKQEVLKLLKSKFSRYYVQDASFKEYGYGATMVILRNR